MSIPVVTPGIKWIIIYGPDGSTFSNLDGTPAEAPGWGVQGIAQVDPSVGYHMRAQGKNYYVYIGKEHDWWLSCDLVGMLDHLVTYPGCIVKIGRGLSKAQYDDLLRKVESDPRLPKKTAHHYNERRK